MSDMNREYKRLREEQVYTLIAFIRNHEWKEIPEDVVDILFELENWYDEYGSWGNA